MWHPWLLARCQEIQANPDGYLDLWAREHYKSTIITFGKSIQDILASHGDDPLPEWEGREVTIGIFSCTRPIAKGFLRQIKREFEANLVLKELFPDVIWDNPKAEAPKWSEDDGLVLRRVSNPKESTIEAWGIVDGQPTSKHFFICLYDDVVTIESVRSPAMIHKTTEAWELSDNLGTEGGKKRYVGTRYHFNDTYRVIMERGSAIPRIHAATIDGAMDGEPALKSREELEEKRRNQGPYTYACQMMQNPLADEKQGFKRDWLDFHDRDDGEGMNVYIVVDPANEKKKTSDYTAMLVIGLGQDKKYYVLDIIRDRMNLIERGDTLFKLHKKWDPLAVGYEKYGMQADITYLEDRMKRENYRFRVVPLSSSVAKNDRIKQLIPVFEQKRWLLPKSCPKTDYEGKCRDLVDVFIHEEYEAFPVPVHDDLLDAAAQILHQDLNASFPRTVESKERYTKTKRYANASAWSA